MILAKHPNDLNPSDAQTGKPSPQEPPTHFRDFCPVDSWVPSVNLYRTRQRIDVCVDLAGVEASSVFVQMEMGQLVIRGVRTAPQPPARAHDQMRIISMEIDHGSFCRTISLPIQVDQMQIQTQYTKGLLWVRLSLVEPLD